MNRFFDATDIERDRFGTYKRSAPVARRRDRDELWIFSPTLCRAALQSSDLTSTRDRLAAQADRAGCIKLARFFRRWLMYSDGEYHRAIREAVLSALRTVSPACQETVTDETIPAFAPNMENFDLVCDFAGPWVWNRLPYELGLTKIEAQYWQPRIDCIVSLPGATAITAESLHAGETALAELHEYMRTQEPANRLLCDVRIGAPDDISEDELRDVVINVVGDGVHPTIAGLSITILEWLKRTDSTISSADFASIVIAKYAPFQYVARRALRNVSIGPATVVEGERVVLCVGAAEYSEENRDDSLPRLEFGHGRHACIGRRIALNTIASGLDRLRSLSNAKWTSVGDAEWLNSLGYLALQRCRITVEPI